MPLPYAFAKNKWGQSKRTLIPFILTLTPIAPMLRTTLALLFALAAALATTAPAHAQDRSFPQPGGAFGGYPAPSTSGAQQYPSQVPMPPVITNVPGREQPGARDFGRPGQPPVFAPGQPGFQPQFQAFPEPEEKNEFQEFITASTGRPLQIFGQSLFRDVPSTFAPVENIPVTPDYVIGPGDELYIRAWGQIDIDYRVTVHRSGTSRSRA